MKVDAYVYVMARQGFHKVGVSISPERRITFVKHADGPSQRGTPISLVWSAYIEDAERVEKLAHKILWSVGKQVQTEWFSASLEECVQAIMHASRIVSGLDCCGIEAEIRGCARRGFRWHWESFTITARRRSNRRHWDADPYYKTEQGNQ